MRLRLSALASIVTLALLGAFMGTAAAQTSTACGTAPAGYLVGVAIKSRMVRTRSDGGPAPASHLIWGVRRDSRRRIVDALRPNWRTAMSSISRTAVIVATALALAGLVD